jgi:chaperone modulatory protein CbpM
MNVAVVVSGPCLGEQEWLALEDFARACGTQVEVVRELVAEGLVTPVGPERFGGEELARVRRIRRLQRDFEVNLLGVAVMLDLLDEMERLRAELIRAGGTA